MNLSPQKLQPRPSFKNTDSDSNVRHLTFLKTALYEKLTLQSDQPAHQQKFKESSAKNEGVNNESETELAYTP